MYSRGMVTLVFVLCLVVVGVGLGIAALLGAFTPVSPAELAALGDFNRIELAASGEMTIIQAGSPSITIDASQRDLRRLRVYVKNKTLTIEHRNDWLNRLSPSDEPIRYIVNVNRLEALSLIGIASLEMDGLAADAFTLSVNGLGNIALDDMDVERLQVDLAGDGEATLTGVAVDQALSISGMGKYDAGNLRSETARVQSSGNSAVILWVTLALDAEITGSGHLSYYGNPTVSKRLSGIGGIEHLGPR